MDAVVWRFLSSDVRRCIQLRLMYLRLLRVVPFRDMLFFYSILSKEMRREGGMPGGIQFYE